MVDSSDILLQLKDIHMPHAIVYWPFAWGVWVLLMGFLCASIYCLYRLVKWFYVHRAKRKALKLLRLEEKRYEQTRDAYQSVIFIADILRRMVKVYFPDKRSAALTGDAWISFLENTSKGLDFSCYKDLLLVYPYTKAQNQKISDLKPLFFLVRQWIKQRSKPCSV